MSWAADNILLDAPQLQTLLKKEQPCCIIDARDEGRRRQRPIAFAIAYSENIKPSPGGYALVVADDDARALQAAQTLIRKSGQTVYAVKGGYTMWNQISKAKGNGEKNNKITLEELDSLSPRKFTIPSNTCEQGKPLHEFK